MANSKQTTKPAPKKSAPKSNSNAGYVPVSRTVITTLQNDKGDKRVIRETTTAPNAKKQSAPKAATVSAAKPAKNGGKK